MFHTLKLLKLICFFLLYYFTNIDELFLYQWGRVNQHMFKKWNHQIRYLSKGNYSNIPRHVNITKYYILIKKNGKISIQT